MPHLGVENLVGKTLGKYKLLQFLGAGSMGAVYRAYDVSLDREVALKVIPSSLGVEPRYVEDFYREAKIVAGLEHPNIVPIYDFGTQDDLSYIAMRLLTGGPLGTLLTQRNITPEETARLLRQLADALDYAHSRHVVHRDIKVNNVVFDQHHNAFLVDFGIAKLNPTEVGLTSTGDLKGTPSYMAPELWRNEGASRVADIYALGVLTYHVLTGSPPFEAPTPYKLMVKHLYEKPAPVCSLQPALPVTLDPVLDLALAKDPHLRYQTARDFAEAFDHAVRSAERTVHSGALPRNQRSLLPASDSATLVTPPFIDAQIDNQSAEPPTPSGLRRRIGRSSIALFLFVATILILFFGGKLIITALQGGVSPTETPLSVALLSITESSALVEAATGSSTPTLDLTPSATVTPSIAATSTLSKPSVLIRRNISVRITPSTLCPPLESIAANITLDILGMSEDGIWYQVRLPNGSVGWIAAGTVDISGDMNEVPIISAPTNCPTPTATPSPTPVDTSTPTPTPTQTLSSTPTATVNIPASDTPTRTVVAGQGTPVSQQTSGVLTKSATMAKAQFHWPGNQAVSICLKSTDFDAYLHLQDAAGQELAFNDDYHNTQDSCIIHYVLPASDVYTVVITSYDRRSTGSYTLEITDFASCGKLPIVRVKVPEANLRSYPSLDSNVIGTVELNECFSVIGRNYNSSWWRIRTADGREAWIGIGSVEIIGDNISPPTGP